MVPGPAKEVSGHGASPPDVGGAHVKPPNCTGRRLDADQDKVRAGLAISCMNRRDGPVVCFLASAGSVPAGPSDREARRGTKLTGLR